jgi:hypothetical protein
MKYNMENEIKLWKELNVSHCEMTFDCGGDSMGDYYFNFFDKENNEITDEKVKELDAFFENEVFNRVDFYVNSDGHYIGESGTVMIRYDESDNEFLYEKSAQSTFNENITEKFTYKLTEEQKKFITEKVNNISGGNDDEPFVDYREDCIITDAEEDMLDDMLGKMDKAAQEYEFEFRGDDDSDDWYTWRFDNDTECKEGVIIEVTRSFTVYRESND